MKSYPLKKDAGVCVRVLSEMGFGCPTNKLFLAANRTGIRISARCFDSHLPPSFPPALLQSDLLTTPARFTKLKKVEAKAGLISPLLEAERCGILTLFLLNLA